VTDPADPIDRPTPDVAAENAAIRRFLLRFALAVLLVVVLATVVGLDDGLAAIVGAGCLAVVDGTLWLVRRA
jgi:hypothetical protein